MQPSNHLPGVDKMFMKVPKEGFYPASKKSMKDTKSVKVIHVVRWKRCFAKILRTFLLQIRPFLPPLISLRFACQHIPWALGESHQAKHQSLLLDSTLDKKHHANRIPIVPGFTYIVWMEKYEVQRNVLKPQSNIYSSRQNLNTCHIHIYINIPWSSNEH